MTYSAARVPLRRKTARGHSPRERRIRFRSGREAVRAPCRRARRRESCLRCSRGLIARSKVCWSKVPSGPLNTGMERTSADTSVSPVVSPSLFDDIVDRRAVHHAVEHASGRPVLRAISAVTSCPVLAFVAQDVAIVAREDARAGSDDGSDGHHTGVGGAAEDVGDAPDHEAQRQRPQEDAETIHDLAYSRIS